MEYSFEMPLCPGCHIRCDLAAPQCGRGLRFKEALSRGEELPQRGGRRGPGGPGGARPEPCVEQKLQFMLTGMLPRVLQQGPEEHDETTNILSWLMRQEGAMTYRIMPERARANADTLYETLEQMLYDGLIEDRYTDWGGQFYWITEAGMAEAKAVEQRKAAAVKEKFAALSDEEKEQLAELLEKLIRRPDSM